MSDLNDLAKPDLQTAYANGDVPDTLLGHLKRLWRGDYTGMSNLVAGMRRWVASGGNVQLKERNSSGAEDVLFDSATKADAAAMTEALDAKADAAAMTEALDAKADAAAMTTALAAKADSSAVIGISQTWQDLTASRAAGTTYTNSSTKPIAISVQLYDNTTGGVTYITGTGLCQGVIISRGSCPTISGQVAIFTLSIIVPPGATYRVNAGSGSVSILAWFELR